MMLSSGSFLEGSRRESRKSRKRLSERRRVFSRLAGTTGDHDASPRSASAASFAQSREGTRRRSSFFKRAEPVAASAPADDEVPGSAFLMAASDSGKISMKIQFHITVAPDNEPLLLDACQLPSSQAPGSPQANAPASPTFSEQASTTSAIGEHINERLNRQNSSLRRRQQLLAMHQQSALDRQQQLLLDQQQQQQPVGAQVAGIQSEDNLTFARPGGPSADGQEAAAAAQAGRLADSPPILGRVAGVRSSTITGGMQDEATLQFLAKHQQPRLDQAGTSVSLTSTGSLLGQHQRLMSSGNNMRYRQEQREHIFFKRDGQRFGHEFTLKLAVDKNYRCLLKVKPLIPLEALSIQGHHVTFVDCSPSSSFSSSGSSGLGGSLSSSAPASSITLCGAEQAAGSRLQQPASGHNILNGNPRHNSIAATTGAANSSSLRVGLLGGGGGGGGDSNSPSSQNYYGASPLRSAQAAGAHQHRRLNHAQTTIGSGATRRSSILNSDLVAMGKQPVDEQNGSNLSLTGGGGQNARMQRQQQLLKQHQHHQMVKHFSASSSMSSSHAGGQLVYMFDWSASRFEVNKNKARTQVQTVLKFKNGQILSLPLQVKFYQPECKQHLSWGSQLHFIDYDCNIDSMGQMNVDRIQYY